MNEQKQLIYVADPMCSWCWGFAPVIGKCAETLRGQAGLKVVPGWLRAGQEAPMGEELAREITHHWHAVAKHTGQTFDFDHPLQADFVYNTGPACMAISVMARYMPGMELQYLHRLHQAFYLERRDLTQVEELARCAIECGVIPDQFAEQLAAPEAQTYVSEDLKLVRSWGIDGFPAALLRDGDSLKALTIGYRPWEDLEPLLEQWLSDR